MSSINLPFELVAFRHVASKKDASKKYTIVEGVLTLIDGSRALCEGFLAGEHHYQSGLYAATFDIYVNHDRRISISFKQLTSKAQKAAA